MEGCCKKSEWETALEAFLTYSQGTGLAKGTVTGLRTRLNVWMEFLAEKKMAQLSEATPQLLGEYQGWLCRRKNRFGKTHALVGQIGMLNALKSFFRYLHVSGKLLSNPSEDLRPPREPQRLPGVILTNREVKKLLSQPDTSTFLGFRDRTMYEIFYSSGLRVGELVHLHKEDFADASLFIKQSKHCKDRYVPLGKIACAYLEKYLSNVRPSFLRASAPLRDEIFLNHLGNPLSLEAVEWKLHVYTRRAKIKKRITPHVFRHTLATEMLKAGADIRQVQAMLGHRSLDTTQIYTHIVKGDLKRVQSHCHPREQNELPEGFVKFRGFQR